MYRANALQGTASGNEPGANGETDPWEPHFTDDGKLRHYLEG